MTEAALRFITCVGDEARLTRVEVDLQVWLRHDRRVILAPTDHELYRLQGLRGPEVWWIDMHASFYQLAWMKTREHIKVPIEVARDVLKLSPWGRR